MTPTRTRAPRNTLDRATVAAAALDLMDAEGAGALTIRALAKRLGVAPMALYNHAATKEDILAAARDHGLARLPAADPGQGHWRDRVRAINLAFHRALREHPSLVGLLVARPLAGQAPAFQSDLAPTTATAAAGSGLQSLHERLLKAV